MKRRAKINEGVRGLALKDTPNLGAMVSWGWQ